MSHALQDATPGPVGKIGPNSVIQLGHAVIDCFGREAAEHLFHMAGLLHILKNPPAVMIDEALPKKLFVALWSAHPDEAPALAADAGRRTADYVIANRIPRIARIAFKILPKEISARLLLRAITRNAWTFAGSGQCTARHGRPSLISIRDNPLCMPDCAWHSAVFERLFERLVARGVKVRHIDRSDADTRVCQFEIALPR